MTKVSAVLMFFAVVAGIHFDRSRSKRIISPNQNKFSAMRMNSLAPAAGLD